MSSNTKRDRAHSHESDDGETGEIIFVERQFPVVLRWPLIWGMVIILLAMIPWSISTANVYSWEPLAVKWMLLGLVFLLVYWGYHFVGWFFTVLILSDEELTLIRQRGIFRRSVQTLTLNNIQSVNYSVPGMQAALFKFGDIKIETLSGSGGIEVETMYKPAQLQTAILEAVQAFGVTTDEA